MKATSVLTAILGVQTNPIENSNSKLLELINEKRSWKDAKAFCAQSGAELVLIKSKKDQRRLEKLTENQMVWIGAKKNKFERWQWLDGDLVEDGFDNFNYEWGYGGDCARKTKIGSWYQSNCEYLAPFVCERNVPRVIGSFGGKYKYSEDFKLQNSETLQIERDLVSGLSIKPVLENHCTVYYKGSVWAFGGDGEPTGSFRLSNGSWSPGPTMPIARTRHSCTVHERQVWICGGQTPEGEPLNDCMNFTLTPDTLGIFGHDMADFFEGPELAETRPRTPNLVSTTRGLYIIGGTFETRLTEIVPTGMNQWAPTSPLPFSLIESTAAVLDDIIYLIGGLLDSSEESANVLTLSPGSMYWEWAGSMALPRSGHAATPVPGAGKIIIQGGRGLRSDEVWFRNDTTLVIDQYSHNRLGSSLLVLPGEFA